MSSIPHTNLVSHLKDCLAHDYTLCCFYKSSHHYGLSIIKQIEQLSTVWHWCIVYCIMMSIDVGYGREPDQISSFKLFMRNSEKSTALIEYITTQKLLAVITSWQIWLFMIPIFRFRGQIFITQKQKIEFEEPQPHLAKDKWFTVTLLSMHNLTQSTNSPQESGWRNIVSLASLVYTGGFYVKKV